MNKIYNLIFKLLVLVCLFKTSAQVDINYVVAKNLFGRPKEFLNAVKKVDIKIRKGSTTGLVGESGSGKSSLARALLGIERLLVGLFCHLFL